MSEIKQVGQINIPAIFHKASGHKLVPAKARPTYVFEAKAIVVAGNLQKR